MPAYCILTFTTSTPLAPSLRLAPIEMYEVTTHTTEIDRVTQATTDHGEKANQGCPLECSGRGSGKCECILEEVEQVLQGDL